MFLEMVNYLRLRYIFCIWSLLVLFLDYYFMVGNVLNWIALGPMVDWVECPTIICWRLVYEIFCWFFFLFLFEDVLWLFYLAKSRFCVVVHEIVFSTGIIGGFKNRLKITCADFFFKLCLRVGFWRGGEVNERLMER